MYMFMPCNSNVWRKYNKTVTNKSFGNVKYVKRN